MPDSVRLIGYVTPANPFRTKGFGQSTDCGTVVAMLIVPHRREAMDLSLGIPVTVILGLLTMAAMFAFVRGCEKV